MFYARWMSFDIAVMCLPWMAISFASSNRPMQYTYEASCSTVIDDIANCTSTNCSREILEGGVQR